MVERAIRLSDEAAGVMTARLLDGVRVASGDLGAYWGRVQESRKMLSDHQPRKSPPWAGASELVIPYVKQAKFALLSHFCPTLLGADPIFHVEGTNAPAKGTSDLVEGFLQAQLTRQVKFRATMERVFDAALRDGTAVVHVGWSTLKRTKPVYEQVVQAIIDPETGELLHAVGSVRQAEREAISYDAPTVELVPLEMFGTFPAANADIQTSPGVFRRFSVTGNDILDALAMGEYDKDAVETMQRQATDQAAMVTIDNENREIGASTPTDTDFHEQSFMLTEIYYRYAPEGSKGIAQDWVFVIHETSQTLLQARPSPWFHQQRPFVAISPYQDVEGIYGDSLASAGAGDVQLAKTTLLRLAVDAAAIGIAPEMLVSESLGTYIDEIKKRRGPGQVIPFPPAYFENNAAKMQPFGSNGYQPTVAMPLLEFLDREGQMSTGVSDTLKGIPNPGNVTATEATQMLESSQKIVAFLTERLATGQTAIGELLLQLNYQFQGNDGPQGLWAELNGEPQISQMTQMVSPAGGGMGLPGGDGVGQMGVGLPMRGPNPPAPFPAREGGVNPVSLFAALQGEYVVSASGIRDTSNRAILAKRAMERMQLLSNEPNVMQNTERRYALLFDVLQANGTANPERYLGSLEEWQQAEQRQQMMQQQAAMMQAQQQQGAMTGEPQMAQMAQMPPAGGG